MKSMFFAAALLAAVGSPAYAEPNQRDTAKAAACTQADLEATWLLAFTYDDGAIFCSVTFNKKGNASGSCDEEETSGKVSINKTCDFKGALKIQSVDLDVAGVLSKDKSVMLGSIVEEGFDTEILHGLKR